MMLVWCVLASCAAVAARAAGAPPAACRAGHDGHSYREELLFSEQSTLITGIDVNWETNDLYYVRQDGPVRNVCYAMKISDKSHREVGELRNDWCHVSIRQRDGHLYAGCGTFTDRAGGLYKFDSNSNKFERLHYHQKYVNHARIFGDILYYTDYDNQLLTFLHGVSQPVLQLQNRTMADFVVDSSGDIVFCSEGGLYVQKADTTQTVQLLEQTSIEQLAMGPRGDIYGCDQDAIYHIDTASAVASKVVDAPSCEKLAIDKDGNFIYANSSKYINYLVKCPE